MPHRRPAIFMFWRICVLFTLVASCAAKAITLQVTGNRAVVGHRVASADEADEYNEEGVPTPQYHQTYDQIGGGTYLTRGRGQWKARKGNKYCIITADRELLNRFRKEWIPQQDIDPDWGCPVQLWGRSDEINAYLKTWQPNDDPTMSLRLSLIERFEHRVQILITHEVLEAEYDHEEKILDLKAECADSLADVPNVSADVYNWEDVEGEPQFPEKQ